MAQAADRSTRRCYEGELSACRGEGSEVGPLLAVRALWLRCAATTMLSPALAMPNCGAQGRPGGPRFLVIPRLNTVYFAK
jgi:hypothetical protein